MIAYLKGSITCKNPAYVHIECNGVGYEVQVSLYTFGKLEDLDEIKLNTYQHIYENGQVLYGFFDVPERDLFVKLISVSGVGPNTARVILSYMDVNEIKSAIANENAVALSKVKGIGPKTAKRIILDLKEKIIKEGVSADNNVNILKSGNTLHQEALSALTALGFPKALVEKQIKSVLASNASINNVEQLIKEVLKKN